MKIFVSYSFRPENDWITDYVIPLIRCFGHQPVTGRILQSGPIPVEVRSLIRSCKRVLCFVTRAAPNYGPTGAIASYAAPDWVTDELMMARGADQDAIEFREDGVARGGTAPFAAWHDFERDNLAALLLRLAELLKQWPIGPLQLRLTVPQEMRDEFDLGVAAGNVRARCTAADSSGVEVFSEELPIRKRGDQFMVPFWVKPDPDLTIDLEILYGGSRLVCKGVIPAVCIAPLQRVV
jgi:hypothetical protein